MGEEIKDWTVWMDDDNGGVGSFRILFSLFSSLTSHLMILN